MTGFRSEWQKLRTNILLARTLVWYLGADYTHKYPYFVAALVDLVGCPVDALQCCFGDDIRATLEPIIRIIPQVMAQAGIDEQ